MKRFLVTSLVAAFIPLSTFAASINVIPSQVLQGDPIMVTVSGANTGDIQSGTVSRSKLYFFTYNGVPTAFQGIDINQKTGTTSVSVLLKNGQKATASFVVLARTRPKEPLSIPAQLGGNSVANQARVVSILEKENANLAAIFSRTDKTLWRSSFSFPVISSKGTPPVVTNAYGYIRDSGAETITHKGADFQAPVGTPVYAINRGVVRVAKTYVVYGNSVIVDHGLNLLSMYMHLSKMVVSPGQLVEKGQLIGYSGDTGYSEGAHLHLSIRIKGISIDPVKFFELFTLSSKTRPTL